MYKKFPEYNNPLGLLISNRTAGRYAPDSTVYSYDEWLGVDPGRNITVYLLKIRHLQFFGTPSLK